MILYDENYFKSGNYVNYLQKYQKYDKLSIDILDLLQKTCLLNLGYDTWLDYGSGPGFFAAALATNGKGLEVYAFDISSWCINELKRKGINVPEFSIVNKFSIVSFLDVFEHIEDEEIVTLLTKKIDAPLLIVRIPVASEEGVKNNKFVLDVSNLDKTHINCKTKKMWESFFKSMGYDLFFKLNLSTIYDSPGVFCAVIKKQTSTYSANN